MTNTSLNCGKKLRQLLTESGTGKKLLSQTVLSPSDRNKICQIIIEKLLSKSIKVRTEEFKEWTIEIVSLFKSEKASTYYVSSNAKIKRFANDKLWDKYNNLKKFVKQHRDVCQEKENITPDCQDTLIVLRAIRPEDKNVEHLWQERFKARDRKPSITEYYEEYPILKTAIGAKLIDFQAETGTIFKRQK
ncbi:uncharacterized protein LOC105190000 [Harpegnathos saltator]|uniref:uncharacterized protein LOC105190000 n=1 Tax=Harpegnathos saltator TaxID=610380 RepID=UPI000DBEE3AD|nr:uncharacterized protein LOC105190000 [Harpegnathos saltator]